MCEQYRFSANGKLVQLDISHELMEKLGLELGKEITYPIYISPSVLKRKPDEFGGITIDNEKDIICQTDGTTLIQEKGVQVDFTSGEITDLKQKLEKSEQLGQEAQRLFEKVLKSNEEKGVAIIFFEQEIKNLTQRITELRNSLEDEILAKKREESKNRELERVIKKLKEDERVLIGLQNRISDLQEELGNQITTLTEERDKIQTDLNDLKGKLENRLKRVQKNFLNSLFLGISRNNKKVKEIKDLEVRIARLRVQLFNKNKEVEKLIIEKDNLQNQLRIRDQTIANLRGDINTWKNNYNNSQRELSDTKSNYSYYYGRYYDKDREVNNLNNRINELQSEIKDYKRKWENLPEETEFILVSSVQVGTASFLQPKPQGYQTIDIKKNSISRIHYSCNLTPLFRVNYYHAKGRISSWGISNNYLENFD